jgi:Xaa-Pro aminopeptidase
MTISLITKRENIRYLTGLNASFGFLVRESEQPKYLVTDARYIERAKQCVKGSQIKTILWNKDGQAVLKKTLQNAKEILVEDSQTLAQLERWKEFFPKATFVPQTNAIEKIRAIKTDEEIEKIRTAATHVDHILSDFKQMKKIFFEGVTEKEATFHLEQLIQDKGKFGIAFPSIVAFGENSAIPHHEPGLRTLKKGDNILVDCGAVFEGYHSDITRNFCLGEPGLDFREAYALLRLAQEKTVFEYFKPGLEISKADEFCRNLLGKEKAFFTHSLGHGVGLEIHEWPTVSSSNSNFQIGHTVTCEPGLYYPGKFGIRIEDLVVITKNGPELLTNTTKAPTDLS